MRKCDALAWSADGNQASRGSWRGCGCRCVTPGKGSVGFGVVTAMRYAQVLVYENDTLLTTMLEEKARQEKWSLRHPRDFAECVALLCRGGAGGPGLCLGAAPGVGVLLPGRGGHLFPGGCS